MGNSSEQRELAQLKMRLKYSKRSKPMRIRTQKAVEKAETQYQEKLGRYLRELVREEEKL